LFNCPGVERRFLLISDGREPFEHLRKSFCCRGKHCGSISSPIFFLSENYLIDSRLRFEFFLVTASGPLWFDIVMFPLVVSFKLPRVVRLIFFFLYLRVESLGMAISKVGLFRSLSLFFSFVLPDFVLPYRCGFLSQQALASHPQLDLCVHAPSSLSCHTPYQGL